MNILYMSSRRRITVSDKCSYCVPNVVWEFQVFITTWTDSLLPIKQVFNSSSAFVPGGIARPYTSLKQRFSILRNIATCKATVSCFSTYLQRGITFLTLFHFPG